MIDTDKYDGGNGSTLSDGPAPWKIEHFPELYAVRETYHDEDLKLIADAPLLLAEVKRLRRENKSWRGSYIDLWNICIALYDGAIELYRFKDWLDERSGGDLFPMAHEEESE